LVKLLLIIIVFDIVSLAKKFLNLQYTIYHTRNKGNLTQKFHNILRRMRLEENFSCTQKLQLNL